MVRYRAFVNMVMNTRDHYKVGNDMTRYYTVSFPKTARLHGVNVF
jgi:hypothetical protein